MIDDSIYLMFNPDQIIIPQEWEDIEFNALQGTIIIIGAPDVGKSTFAKFLYHRLIQSGKQVAFLDGDPGQSVLGPPTTITLSQVTKAATNAYKSNLNKRYFIGSTSPRGHMLQILVGAKRVIEYAENHQFAAVVYDTTGLIDPVQGGVVLKYSKIELLHPAYIFAIQRLQELEPLLVLLRKSLGNRLIELPASRQVVIRNVDARRSHRSKQYQAYFTPSVIHEVSWKKYAIYPFQGFSTNRIIGFEDQNGFLLGLGVVLHVNHNHNIIRVYTPLKRIELAKIIKIGDIILDLDTFQDRYSRLVLGGNDEY